MSKAWKYILNISMSALTILSIGIPVTNTSVNARHVRTHHISRHLYKSHRTIYKSRSRRRMRKYHSSHRKVNHKYKKRNSKHPQKKLWQPIAYPEIPRDSNWKGWNNNHYAMEGYSPNTWAPSGEVVTPTKTKNNEFYKIFNKALKHTSKRVQREPFNINGLKHLDYIIGHGGHYFLKNNKYAMAQDILTGENDPISVANIDGTSDANYEIGKSWYYDPIMEKWYGDKESYNQGEAYDKTNEIRLKTLLDLNNDRKSIGESPLQWSTRLDDIAQERSQQLIQNYSHYDPNNNGEPYALEDGLSPQNWGENIAESSGESLLGTANTINKMFFYDEEPTNGIHYRNIANNTYVGVGATIKNGTTYLSEDFE